MALKYAFIFSILFLFSCAPETTYDKFDKIENRPRKTESFTNEFYFEPQTLVKSSPSKQEFNHTHIRLKQNSKLTTVIVPYYFNTEKHSSIKVSKPRFAAEGCNSNQIEIGSFLGIPALSMDSGHNPNVGKVGMIFGRKESLDVNNSDLTISIVFEVPAACESVDLKFEAVFE